MQSQIKLGRLFGFEVGLHYSWILIALLIVFSLVGHFSRTNPEWGWGITWITAVVTAALFFVSILLHELSHALVAKGAGIPVRAITLFALGGVAHIEKEAATPKAEFWMGIIGPITSALIGGMCIGLALLLGWRGMAAPSNPLLATLGWLGYINLTLALFNLIPGFPLDGGRVLRAILWWVTGNSERATRTAARVGQVVALAFIVLGILQFFSGAGFGGLWLAFIGWFLFDVARMSVVQSEMFANLRGIHVGDIMSQDCVTVDRHADVQTFAEDYLLRTGRRCFLVKDQGEVVGLVTPNEIRAVERAQWPYTPLEKVMQPLHQIRAVQPNTPVTEALETMRREDVNQLPVMADGQLAGIVARSHILQLLEARTELQQV